MNKLKKVVVRILYRSCSILFPNIHVFSIEDTMKEIIKNKVSVSRFGDGEFKWIYGIFQNSFQDDNEQLGKKLKQVIQKPKKNCLICIPPIFDGINQFTSDAAFFWKKHYIKYFNQWAKLLNTKVKYYNANITRPYMEYKDKSKSKKIFNYWKEIFNNRNLLIVEGVYTRFGVGNDFLRNAASVNRIICPSNNAFQKIDTIEKKIKEEYKKIENPLVLVALGPTATIIAYDLCDKGMQIIDIGHADIEYEWFLKKARTKISIKNKFVNEAGDNVNDFGIIQDPIYNSEIVCVIKQESEK